MKGLGRRPWQVWLMGLSRPSWARTEDITAVSVQRFVRPQPLGRVSAIEVERLSERLREMVAFA